VSWSTVATALAPGTARAGRLVARRGPRGEEPCHEEIVEDLRGELKSPYCKPRPRRPVQTPHREPQDPQDPLLPIKQAVKQSLTRCGDGVCDPGESAGNCCDCRCADGKRCPEGKRCPDGKRCESPNGEAICVDSVRRLKD